MKKATVISLVIIMLFSVVYAVYSVPTFGNNSEESSVTSVTETTDAPEVTVPVTEETTVIQTEEATAPPETETTVVTETEEPETIPPETTEPPVTTTTAPPETTLPPVTTTTAPPPPPVDYSNLAGEYGFDADLRSGIAWAELNTPSSQAIDPAKPMLALTFDDGPGRHTERLLNIFAENGGRGTFFVVGYRISGNEHILSRMASEGHELGGHSWWHSNMNTLGERALTDEIMMTRERIYAATGVDSKIVRPPYGAYNDFVKWMGSVTGVAFVNWSVDTLDWKSRNADAVYNAVIDNAYDGAIILCHDLHGTTVDAMERAIPRLIEDGYQLVTVSELMAHRGAAFEAGRVYSRG